LLEEIAQLEKVEVSGEEIASEIEKIAQYYHSTPEEIRTSLTKHGGENSIADRIRSRKAVEVLVENAKITEGEWIEESGENSESTSGAPLDVEKPEVEAELSEAT
jgi:FKBP-type peptidyl-prolyl cis-trans isomerase (trigger factor)